MASEVTAPVALDAAIEEARKALGNVGDCCDAAERDCVQRLTASTYALLSALSADRRTDSGLALMSEQWSRCERERDAAEAALREIERMCANGYYPPDNATYTVEAKRIARRYFAAKGGDR